MLQKTNLSQIKLIIHQKTYIIFDNTGKFQQKCVKFINFKI